MKDIINSFTESFKEKINSPIYGIFIVAVIGWNWRAFYVLFFENSDLLNNPKIEYAQQFSRVQELSSTGQRFFDIVIYGLNLILPPLFIFGVPIIVTYLAIWQLPKIHQHAHRTYLRFKFDRKKEFHIQNVAFQESIAVQKEKEVKAVERKAVAEQKIEGQLSPEEKWGMEFEEFRKHSYFSKFNKILDIIYKHGGQTEPFVGVGRRRITEPEILAFIHSKNLINIKRDKNNYEIIEATDKGKFFIEKYLERNAP